MHTVVCVKVKNNKIFLNLKSYKSLTKMGAKRFVVIPILLLHQISCQDFGQKTKFVSPVELSRNIFFDLLDGSSKKDKLKMAVGKYHTNF